MTIAPNDFTHLHVHSEFSLLDGLGRIDDLIDEAVRLGFDSLAITDHGALYGAVAFYQACQKRSIKPIIGVETYVARRSMTDREGEQGLPALSPDPAGQGLDRLPEPVPASSPTPTSTATTTSRASTRTTSPSTARGSSACRRASTARSPGRSRPTTGTSARRIAGSYSDILGPDGFYLELQDHEIPEQHRLNEKLLRLGPEMGLPLVATNDLHYVHREQREAHDVLLCIGTASMVEQTNRMRFETEEFYLKSAAQMAALFPDLPEAITQHPAHRRDDRCPVRLRDAPPAATSRSPTATPSRAGCARNASAACASATAPSPTRSSARLDYELGIIIQMGYAGYFLIVADFVRFAREHASRPPAEAARRGPS